MNKKFLLLVGLIFSQVRALPALLPEIKRLFEIPKAWTADRFYLGMPYKGFGAAAQGMLEELRNFDVGGFLKKRLYLLGSNPAAVLLLSSFVVYDLAKIYNNIGRKNKQRKVARSIRHVALRYALPLFFVTHVYKLLEGSAQASIDSPSRFAKLANNWLSARASLIVASVLLTFITGRALDSAFNYVSWVASTFFGGINKIFDTLHLPRLTIRRRMN